MYLWIFLTKHVFVKKVCRYLCEMMLYLNVIYFNIDNIFQESQMSLQCMSSNAFVRDRCVLYFDNYNNCVKFWVRINYALIYKCIHFSNPKVYTALIDVSIPLINAIYVTEPHSGGSQKERNCPPCTFTRR